MGLIEGMLWVECNTNVKGIILIECCNCNVYIFFFRNVLTNVSKSWPTFSPVSIHPSIHGLLLIQSQVAVAAGSVGYSRLPFPKQRFPASPQGSWGGPRPDEIYYPSNGFWVCPWVSSKLDMPPKGGALVLCPWPFILTKKVLAVHWDETLWVQINTEYRFEMT